MSDLNDPRVFFAAERTLLAWSRTSLTLMGFGFIVERFGLFMQLLLFNTKTFQRGISFWVGILFILLGSFLAFLAVLQFRKVLETLRPPEIPLGYWVGLGVFTNVVLGLLGLALTVYLFMGTK